MFAGENKAPYSGTFDGNGHKLTVGTFASSGESGGTHGSLFVRVAGATFKNLTISGSFTNAGLIENNFTRLRDNGDFVPTVIDNCTVSGSVSGTDRSAGFIAICSGEVEISNSTNAASISINEGGGCAAGFIAASDAMTLNTQEIGDEVKKAEGITKYIGEYKHVKIENSTNRGAVSSHNSNKDVKTAASGFISYVGSPGGTEDKFSCVISHCQNTANISNVTQNSSIPPANVCCAGIIHVDSGYNVLVKNSMNWGQIGYDSSNRPLPNKCASGIVSEPGAKTHIISNINFGNIHSEIDSATTGICNVGSSVGHVQNNANLGNADRASKEAPIMMFGTKDAGKFASLSSNYFLNSNSFTSDWPTDALMSLDSGQIGSGQLAYLMGGYKFNKSIPAEVFE